MKKAFVIFLTQKISIQMPYFEECIHEVIC